MTFDRFHRSASYALLLIASCCACPDTPRRAGAGTHLQYGCSCLRGTMTSVASVTPDGTATSPDGESSYSALSANISP
jgi:hypothetical protein